MTGGLTGVDSTGSAAAGTEVAGVGAAATAAASTGAGGPAAVSTAVAGSAAGAGPPLRAAEPGTSGLWRGPRAGRVVAFDDRRGLGAVCDERGTQFAFHCTAIADGTRRIVVGAPVVFVLVAGHRGRLEAHGIRPLPEAVSPEHGRSSVGS
ncbi:MAG: hypothetical protein M0Z63_11885 [Actinomycetota bacterium]|nr:hypothetical protein [Actinomycetota bacterium]